MFRPNHAIIPAAALSAGLVLSACVGQTPTATSQPEAYQYTGPVDMAQHLGKTIAKLIDDKYATTDCLAGLPYDPFNEQSDIPDASVKATLGAYNTEVLALTPSGGPESTTLYFYITDNQLRAHDYATSITLAGYKNCPK